MNLILLFYKTFYLQPEIRETTHVFTINSIKNQHIFSGSFPTLPITHFDWSFTQIRSVLASINLKFFASISLFVLLDWIGQWALDACFVAFGEDAFPAFSTVLFGLLIFLYHMPDFDDFHFQVRKRYLIMLFRDGREGLDLFHSLRTHRWSSR